MTQFTVTVVDTTGKQNYVFSSNRLRENIGASFLLSQSTKDWVKETLVKIGVPQNSLEEPIESSNLNAELVYAAGGNALIIFKSRKIAVKFTQILSRKVLEEAPGVQLLVAHTDFDWDSGEKLFSIVKQLKSYDIERQKYERIQSAPLLGLGVTASCDSTQLPAIDRSDTFINYEEEEEADSYFISNETKQKLYAVSHANKELQKIFKDVVDQNIFQFPYRTDHLGRSRGESSYAAIVHADGNGMGKRFQQYGESKGEDNRNYILAMRNFSESVDKAGIRALKEVARILINCIQEGKVIGKVGEFNLNAKYYLPFRPILYAGDDITFICEGRLGLDLAALFLKKFEEQVVADGKPLTACAGVCVVKTHYPFARAYEISEDLCKEAKKHVKQNQEFEPDGFSALDWHLAASGLIGSVSEIRKREYKITAQRETYNLAMRPVRLKANDSEWQTWDGFTQIVKEFNQGENWKGRQNKIMDLREVLRQGSIKAVEGFLLKYKLPNLPLFPELSGQSQQLSRYGWVNNQCGYFDAIEAMEFYLGLED